MNVELALRLPYTLPSPEHLDLFLYLYLALAAFVAVGVRSLDERANNGCGSRGFDLNLQPHEEHDDITLIVAKAV